MYGDGLTATGDPLKSLNREVFGRTWYSGAATHVKNAIWGGLTGRRALGGQTTTSAYSSPEAAKRRK
jgi:hypothetical protein